MEIYFTNSQFTDFGKALIETLQQTGHPDAKLLVDICNFLKKYPTVSEQLAALKDDEMEHDLSWSLIDKLGYNKYAEVMEENIGKPVLARQGIFINPASQDELPQDRFIDIYFTRDTPEFLIDKPIRGFIRGDAELNIQAGEFVIVNNNKTVHLSGDVDVTLDGIHAIASGNCQLELSSGCWVEATDQVKIKNEYDYSFIEVNGGHVQIEGDNTSIVVHDGAPTIQVDMNALVVTETPSEAAEKPQLSLGRNTTWVYQSYFEPKSIDSNTILFGLGPEEGVMERVIESLKASSSVLTLNQRFYDPLPNLNQIKKDLIQLLPNSEDFRQKVKAASNSEQLVRSLPDYLPRLAKAGLNANFLKDHFDSSLLEKEGIYTVTDTSVKDDGQSKHFFGSGLYTVKGNDESIHAYEHAIVMTTDYPQAISAHGESLVLAQTIYDLQTDGQSCVLAEGSNSLLMNECSLAAIPYVNKATQNGYSCLLCDRLLELSGNDQAVTCLRDRAVDDHDTTYQGRVFETRPDQPDRLFDVNTEACYYATPAMLFKENQRQYEKANQIGRGTTNGRGRS